jgi:phosphate transport system ATP-binding protein
MTIQSQVLPSAKGQQTPKPRTPQKLDSPEPIRVSSHPSVPESDRVTAENKVQVSNLHAGFGKSEILKGITLPILAKQVTAIIGPSGCGKSTFIRCLNRMHEVVPNAWAQGTVALDGVNILERRVDPVLVRRRVGMVFQKPNPFPTMSVRDNVLAGLRLNALGTESADDTVERRLRQVALWDEVKDGLGRSGMSLSGGQQQRLCIARALAMEPEVLLMDEPCSALDPIATARVEELIHGLRKDYTIAIVTHNMQQAARVADTTAFFYLGTLVEYGNTDTLFTRPKERRTEEYITGRFG